MSELGYLINVIKKIYSFNFLQEKIKCIPLIPS